jgi:pimeloyl-ACP methyl ester carboxylesterase
MVFVCAMSNSLHFVSSGNAELATSIAGDGNALVFLHAGVADRRMWSEQMAAFAPTHRVVAYDRRGFGETQYTEEPHSYLGDLDAVLRATVEGPATLVGCSQGGRIAIDFALTAPERVTRLVLVSPAVTGAPRPEEVSPSIRRLFGLIEAAEAAEDIERLNAIEAHVWLDGPLSPEGRAGGALRSLFLDMNGRALRALPAGAETSATNAFARLGEIQHQTLIVSGALDFPHIKERARHLASVMADARLVEMPCAAHLPNLEQPDAFGALLQEFMRQAKAGNSSFSG